MAENEVLNVGHATRWRHSRGVLKDPNSTWQDLVEVASEDFREAVRRLPGALRKGPPLITLIKAMQGSAIGLQEAISAFTEKRLANIVIAAAKCAEGGSTSLIANNAADQILKGVVDQIMARIRKAERFFAPGEQSATRSALTAAFAVHAAQLSETIGCSIGGIKIKRNSTPRIILSGRQRSEAIATMSLLPRNRRERVNAL